MALDQDHLDQLEQAFDRSEDDLTLALSEDENGTIRLEYTVEGATRPVGIFQFTLGDTYITYDILNFVPEYRHVGFYRRAGRFFPDWFRTLGITHGRVPIIMEHGGEFHKDLMDTGWEENADGTFSCDVSRMDEYNAWVYDSAEEPQWHAELPEEFRVTTEPGQF